MEKKDVYKRKKHSVGDRFGALDGKKKMYIRGRSMLSGIDLLNFDNTQIKRY
jgi:hypothetical protein